MINVLISGCLGKMGQTVCRLCKQQEEMKISAGYDIHAETGSDFPVYTDLNECKESIDVIIDFSNPDSLPKLLEYAQKNSIPAVLATTGYSQQQKNLIEKASENIAIFQSANMSFGVNLVCELVKKAASLLEDTFDIEIVEKHHNRKIDAPSGTALLIADSMNEALSQKHEYVYDRHSRCRKRNKKEIGIHAVRGGTIVGEHSIIFAGEDEIIEITHTALSRDIFAAGALKAARFLTGMKPGIYKMDNMLNG